MTASTHERAATGHKTVVLERAFAAPRELVFRVFTDPEHLVKWWFPYPLTFAVCEWDARPGGAIRLEMETSDGIRFPFIGAFLDVVPPERVVFFTQQNIDAAGVPDTEVVNTVTFTERGNQTIVRVQLEVTKSGPTTAATLEGTVGGWMQDLGRLAFYLLHWTDTGDEIAPVITTPSDREIVLTRTYSAPPAPVFAAIPRRGEPILIVPDELVVTSVDSESPSGQRRIDAVHLYERNGTTRLTRISLFETREERDRALESRMVSRVIESYEQLEHLLLVRADVHQS